MYAIESVDKSQWVLLKLVLDDFVRDSKGRLLNDLGDQVVASTRNRISKTKVSPDGGIWKPWSPSYAQTRSVAHSLLVDTGDLLSSVDKFRRKSDMVTVEPTVPYARANQKTRPFMGLSIGDLREAENTINKFVREYIS